MRRRTPLVAALLALLLWPAAAAGQAGGVDVGITGIKAPTATSAWATVKVSGSAVGQTELPRDAFGVTVAGKPARITRVASPDAARTQVSVLLLLDTSGSMKQDDNISRAKAAADRFVEQLRPGSSIGVLAFSDRPQLVQQLTPDQASAKRSIATLQASGHTALYDAIVQGAGQLAGEPGQHAIVLLSDGVDDGSAHSFADAIAAARQTKGSFYSIGLSTAAGAAPAGVLTSLARSTKGGRFIPAQGARLNDLYASLGRELYSQYRVDFEVPPGTPNESVAVVTVRASAAQRSSDPVPLLLPPAAPGPPGERPGVPGLARLQTQEGLYLTVGLMFAAVLLLAYALLATPPGSGKSYRELRQRLSQYSLTSAIADDGPQGAFGSSDLVGRATEFAESLVQRGNLEEAFLTRIELAGLNLRVAEFVLISLASAIGFPLLLLLVTRNLLITILGVMIGVLAPFLFLILRTSRRRAKFDGQLPDTLQLLGGALQAGHSLLQALDTVVKESEEPMSVEFQRVLTEARLGMPLEEALESMAKRMDSRDFEWTVMAVSLQRQVGGNLAELLNTVAQTIRERYSLKRQIKSLSAEGRLSSVILSVLPFIMFFVLLLFNRTFLAPLYTTALGVAMLSASAILMTVGILWMKKITDIEV
jgi:tight adherence protein B